MKLLIVEDWWADRLRFEYLLENIKGLEIDFAWSAGRPPKGGQVWSVKKIVSVADQYDRIIIDLALNKKDEDQFREVHKLNNEEFLDKEDTLDDKISGLQLIAALAAKKSRGKDSKKFLRERCIIASAHVYDRLRDHCVKKWGIIDTFHKWSDEDQIVLTLYDSKLRAN